MAGVQDSSTNIKSPFGNLPFASAYGLQQSQLSPLIRGLGIGGGPDSAKWQQFQSRLGEAQGPLAGFIRNVQGFAPTVFPQAQAIGNEMADRGRQATDVVQGQINSYLSQLPGFSSQMGHATDLARHYADQQFSPTANEDLYQMAQSRLTNALRPGEAARGLESSGTAQQAETDATRQLVGEFAQQQRAAQPGAIQGLQGAVGNQANVAQSGIGVGQQGVQNVGQLGQFLQQRYGIPQEALGSLLQLLTAGQAGTLGLTQATAPIAAPSSKGVHTILS